MRTGAAGVLVGFGGGAVSANRNTIGVHAPMPPPSPTWPKPAATTWTSPAAVTSK